DRKVLPPPLVEKPNPKGNFEEGPLFLNTEARPWVHGGGQSRVAGVSAFGFGGTNFHAVLEEYTNGYLAEPAPALRHWPAELLVWRRPTRAELVESVEKCGQALAGGARPGLGDLAQALARAARGEETQPTLAIVAASLEELQEKLGHALEALRGGVEVPPLGGSGKAHAEAQALPTKGGTPTSGAYFAEQPGEDGGKVAFLFPGQGSQYPNMLAQVALVFAEVREACDQAERALHGRLEQPLGRFLFPPSTFSSEREQ